ncbi:MAG TPA: 30S ribosomal protein S6 [Deltaproteobacteria bacterium]|nr:MAG: 30S ribosomal protein S6 [Deltaproteobacteria bacterium GWA2_43_19]OGQ12083.1 MAG: 30S ribosomal protein S6 [Deltaproteobacteria bacterium RIFCSPHIGHO2_02_FULL_43_33]OGQ37083.1 MAG: 30S ribosomal protein S6 [Deltaproteobacteria bacterium RIFCSPLOWO2_01_FULL_42_9]HBR16615.1 30S ribosomal protein S6 [Deltaproteobacteria bacterium]
MNNHYEVVFIARPDAGDIVTKGIIQKVRETVEGLNGQVIKVEEWGKRRMAYPIRKYPDGYYVFVEISANPQTSKEVERILRLNEDVIRYQTIRKIETKTVKKTKKKKKISQAKETNQ